MKRLIIPALLVVSASSQTSNYIRQFNYTTGVTRDVELSTDSGTITSPLEIPKQGARFELYAFGVGNDTSLYNLDTKIVGTYTPNASINIVSTDPHPVTRTRVDIPFQVNISYQHNFEYPPELVTPEEIANYDAFFLHEGENFSTEVPSDQSQRYAINQYDIEVGDVSEERLSVLDFTDSTKAYGEETFAIKSAITPVVTEEGILASDSIQIIPLAEAAITGIEDGEKYLFSLADVRIDLKNLYPESHTYVQIYAGEEEVGTLGTIIPNVYITYSDEAITTPQDSTLILSSWDNVDSSNVTFEGDAYTLEDGKYILKDRVYTLEVLTKTPFFEAPERLAHVTFELDKEVTVRASVTTSEK